MNEPGVLAVFATALAKAVATGLGAGPFLFVAHLARSWVGFANALAAPSWASSLSLGRRVDWLDGRAPTSKRRFRRRGVARARDRDRD